MAVDTQAFAGFETGDLGELFATSGSVTVSSTISFTGDYGCRVQNVSSIKMNAVADQPFQSCVFNIRVDNAGAGIPVRLYNSTETTYYGFEIDWNGTTNRYEITVDYNGTTKGTYPIGMSTGGWFNFSMTVSQYGAKGATGVSIWNGPVLICHESDAPTVSVSRLKIEGKTGADFYLDDLVLGSNTYTARVTKLYPVLPNGERVRNIASEVPSGSQHHLVLDEPGNDGDTSYVSTTSATHQKDIYSMQDLSDVEELTWEMSFIFYVVTVGVWRIVPTSNGYINMYLRSRLGNDYNVGSGTKGDATYKAVMGYSRWDINEDYSGSWRLSSINDLEAGFEIRNDAALDTRVTKFFLYLVASVVPKAIDIEQPELVHAGFDLRFDMPALVDGYYMGVKCDAEGAVTAQDKLQDIAIIFERSGANMLVKWAEASSYTTLMEVAVDHDPTVGHEVRVYLHHEFVSVYLDDEWIWSFWVPVIVYPSGSIQVWLIAEAGQASPTFNNVRLVQLWDWREAIFIEMEANGATALSYIIQQRPVEFFPRYDGALGFAYDFTRTNTTVKVRDYLKSIDDPEQAGSDVLVYAADGLQRHEDADFAENYGFALRVLNFAELDSGSLNAAKITLDRIYARRIMHRITARPDLRVEVGDSVTVNDTVTGTEYPLLESFIVETNSISLQQGSASQTLQGRQA